MSLLTTRRATTPVALPWVTLLCVALGAGLLRNRFTPVRAVEPEPAGASAHNARIGGMRDALCGEPVREPARIADYGDSAGTRRPASDPPTTRSTPPAIAVPVSHSVD
ncbi:MAG: hypothetical protein GY711_35450 [bacterium]|nr:hypothetical protein [bacterium]